MENFSGPSIESMFAFNPIILQPAQPVFNLYFKKYDFLVWFLIMTLISFIIL